MDSRLLNVVYDDPFDGNYAKYDNNQEFWSNGTETMAMQLTETLNGILPIAPTEEFNNEEHTNAITIQNNKNGFNYEDFSVQQLATGGAIEIVTVDPNADGYDTDSDDEIGSDDSLHIELQSQCSNDTFRTRTDSSSIGDYESHTSDYDDDDDDDNEENNITNNDILLHSDHSNGAKQLNKFFTDSLTNLVAPDDLLLDTSQHKSHIYSANIQNSDVDALGLQFDVNNFDLADFITKDDFNLQNIAIRKNCQSNEVVTTNTTVGVSSTSSTVVQVISSNHNDSDSDSDVIVDVETVEVDEDEASFLRNSSKIMKSASSVIGSILVQAQTEEDTPYVDNVNSDPSWTPKQVLKKVENHKVEEKHTALKPKLIRNFPLLPNKKQCDLLKGKFAKSKGKPLQKPAKMSATKNSKMENYLGEDLSTTTTTTTSSTVQPENSLKQIGFGIGGKNLALNKNKLVSSLTENRSEDTSIQVESVSSSSLKQQQKLVSIKKAQETPAQAVKRKLNLEEYKKRRGAKPLVTVSASTTNEKSLLNTLTNLDNSNNNNQNIKDKNSTENPTHTKHSTEVISIVKTLKEQKNAVPKTDPITEAKNKVLRMQEMKKAHQIRIIESTIAAKVPRVTKLLPLREIVKDTPYLNEKENKSLSKQTLKSDYEEIIIVSVSCNTDISIPFSLNQAIQPMNNASRSLLKSSALLSTISNSFQKVKATSKTKVSTSSLIASIQDVVVKKTLPLEEEIVGDFKGNFKEAKKPEHHGENKIIMHLRKDRIRTRMCTIGTQTDLQPEFPPLPLPKTSFQHKSRHHTSRHRKRQYRKHKESSSSSSTSSSSDEQSDNSNSSGISRSRDNSCSSSLERMRTYDSAIGTGGYSSRSSRKHRSSISSSYSESADRVARGRRQRRTSYSKRSAARKRSRSPYSSTSYTSDSDRSRSPLYRRSRSRSCSRRSSHRQGQNNNFVFRNVSQPAVEERRIVYVGRIEQETTKDILRRKFLQYGTIKQISIHYKDTGMKYGFVTFERSQDAFAAIDCSTRDPQINMYDVSFGGRRAFCRASYADLDNAGINTYQSYVFPQPAAPPKEEDSFEALLMKMKAKLNANKTNASTNNITAVTNKKATATNGHNAANNKM